MACLDILDQYIAIKTALPRERVARILENQDAFPPDLSWIEEQLARVSRRLAPPGRHAPMAEKSSVL